MSSRIESNNRIHQKQLKNQIKQHQNELKELKLNHEQHKNNLRLENDKDILAIHTQNKNERLNKIKKHEEILEKLQDNLDRVKKNTSTRLEEVESSHDKKLKNKNLIFEEEIKNTKSKNALKLQEAQEISNAELRRLRRSFEQEKNDLKRNSLRSISQDKAATTAKRRMDASEYKRLEMKEADKFQRALLKQKTENYSIISSNKRKLENTVELQDKTAKNDIQRIKAEHNQKRLDEHKRFESKYQQSLESNNKMLQSMLGKKEKLISDLEKEIINKKDLALSRKDDQFYSMGKIQVSVKELDDDRGYQINIPVNESEASNIDFKAENRELRVSMERAHKAQVNEDGKFNSVSKIETYISKIPVESIVDPSTIEKSYSNGVLSFNIGLA